MFLFESEKSKNVLSLVRRKISHSIYTCIYP